LHAVSEARAGLTDSRAFAQFNGLDEKQPEATSPRYLDRHIGEAMAFVKWFAVLPFLGILVGTPFVNRVEPLILGMPLILAWIVLWIILTAAIMAIIYLIDPANRDVPEGRE
jgi:Protein of unknown function (DUF3311)